MKCVTPRVLENWGEARKNNRTSNYKETFAIENKDAAFEGRL
jgi:hypothetical protein